MIISFSGSYSDHEQTRASFYNKCTRVFAAMIRAAAQQVLCMLQVVMMTTALHLPQVEGGLAVPSKIAIACSESITIFPFCRASTVRGDGPKLPMGIMHMGAPCALCTRQSDVAEEVLYRGADERNSTLANR